MSGGTERKDAKDDEDVVQNDKCIVQHGAEVPPQADPFGSQTACYCRASMSCHEHIWQCNPKMKVTIHMCISKVTKAYLWTIWRFSALAQHWHRLSLCI